MAYVADNLRLISADISGRVGKLWSYTTAADADATIVGAGYFSDGNFRGMAIGDIVDVIATTGPKFKRYQVSASSASTGAATVAAPTAIT
jgi:hypothetical protein